MPGKRRPPPQGGFSDPHGTISNIGYFPDQQGGYGNCGFQDLVYRPEAEQRQQPSLLGGIGAGLASGGLFGGLMGGLGAMLGGKTPSFNREAQPPASCPAPAQPQVLQA
ncbi:MAG: hypothetical protein KC621_24455 [Myxococcales bacterium]|nr:hypothetical protein [Myxococcales bacterium]